jgi:hypothetical protein
MIDVGGKGDERAGSNPNGVQSRTMAVQGRIGEPPSIKLGLVQVQHGFEPRVIGEVSLGALYVSRLAARDRRPWTRLLDE